MQPYLQMLQHILDNGTSHKDRTGVGTISVFGYTARYNLADGFPILTTKFVPFKVVAEELFWFLSGSTRLSHLQERGDSAGNPIRIWDAWGTAEKCSKFNRPAGEFGPTYGHCWRNFGASALSMDDDPEDIAGYYDNATRRWINWGYAPDGFDQIKALCDDLQAGPGSRRLIVDAWHARDARLVELPPCHPYFQLKWQEETNTLDLETHMRSADAFLGVPFNLTSYALLLSLLAKLFNMVPGTLVQSFGDLHIYANHVDQVRMQLRRPCRERPKLLIDETLPPGFEGLMAANWGSLKLLNYNHDSAIKAPVAV